LRTADNGQKQRIGFQNRSWQHEMALWTSQRLTNRAASVQSTAIDRKSDRKESAGLFSAQNRVTD
jgi:hypothetical protein